MPAPASARRRQRREIVDVEDAAVGEHLQHAEASHGAHGTVVLHHGGDPVALRALQLVDAPHELALAGELGPQRAHRLERQAGLAGAQLADRHRRRTERSVRAATRASGRMPVRQPSSRSESRAERSRASARQASTSELS